MGGKQKRHPEVCSECGGTVMISHRRTTGPYRCHRCKVRASMRVRYHEDPEQWRARSLQNYAKHRDRYIERGKEKRLRELRMPLEVRPFITATIKQAKAERRRRWHHSVYVGEYGLLYEIFGARPSKRAMDWIERWKGLI